MFGRTTLLIIAFVALIATASAGNIPNYSTGFSCTKGDATGGAINDIDLVWQEYVQPQLAGLANPNPQISQVAAAKINAQGTRFLVEISKELAWLEEVKGVIYGLQAYYKQAPADIIYALSQNSTEDYFIKIHTLGLTNVSLALISDLQGLLSIYADNITAASPLTGAYTVALTSWPAVKAQALAIATQPFTTRIVTNPLTGLPLTNPPNANQLAMFGLGSSIYVTARQYYLGGVTNGTVLSQIFAGVLTISDIVSTLIDSTKIATVAQPSVYDRPRAFNDKIVKRGICSSEYYEGIVNSLGAPNGDQLYDLQKSTYLELVAKYNEYAVGGWTDAEALAYLRFYFGNALDGTSGFMFDRLKDYLRLRRVLAAEPLSR